jgi:hypothetical protein
LNKPYSHTSSEPPRRGSGLLAISALAHRRIAGVVARLGQITRGGVIQSKVGTLNGYSCGSESVRLNRIRG